MYTYLCIFFWAVSGTRLDLSFNYPSATFQVQMNLKERLVIPNLSFILGYKYEAAESVYFIILKHLTLAMLGVFCYAVFKYALNDYFWEGSVSSVLLNVLY